MTKIHVDIVTPRVKIAPVVNPVRALQAFVTGCGSGKIAALKLGVSPPFLSMMLHGQRHVSPRVLRQLGLTKRTRTIFERVIERKAS